MRLKRIFITLGAAFAVTFVLLNLEFNLFEAHLYDFRVRNSVSKGFSPNVALVVLDEKTITTLKDFPPLALDAHARLLDRLSQTAPQSVGYLIDLNSVHQVDPDLFESRWGKEFVDAAQKLESNQIPVLLGTPFDITGEIVPPFPVSTLRHAVALIHKDGSIFSEDKVTRRALTRLNGKPTFHLSLVETLRLQPTGFRPQGSYSVDAVAAEYFYFRYSAEPWVKFLADGSVQTPIPSVSFIDVIQDKIPASFFKGKTVLVGSILKENPDDFAKTPYSKNPTSTPKLLVHASIVDSLARNNGILMAPHFFNWLITFALTFLIFWWVMASTPLAGVFTTLGLACGFLLFAQILFQGFGGLPAIAIRTSQPLVGIFLSYYLVVPYRLILEYKKRWDYQRKNELLTQVEELKTNFLSLVTHDLKTPVARIQGLAEVILKKAGQKLSSEESKNLNQIILSTEQLNQFISRVLELTKIQSDQLQMAWASKDLNRLIEDCVESFRSIALAKSIQIKANLEPLFPIRMDSHLISKVLNNILDNAIKYSPPHSQIQIHSEEFADYVEVQIKDQGIGLSDGDMKSIFTKFYRAKNETTAKIPGTGLGLYLSKYFVEAHQGRLSIDSKPQQGTQVTIQLPLTLPQVLPLATNKDVVTKEQFLFSRIFRKSNSKETNKEPTKETNKKEKPYV